MKRLLGILAINVIVFGILVASNPDAASPENLQNLARRVGFYGIFTIGAGILIISGGIDLSIGSVIGHTAVAVALMLEQRVSPLAAMAVVLCMGVLIGLLHGVLVTRLRLQPFVVTLCGLFIYRGLAQLAASINWRTWEVGKSARDVGLENRADLQTEIFLATGKVGDTVPMIFLILLGVAALVAVILHFSVYGRYLYAVGYNEQAARYAGIATDRYKILAYVICSVLAGVSGILYMLDVGTAQPSTTGSWYELYAITGAVLGGCSLRGGQGTVVGMLLGTAVLPLLRNLTIFAGVPSNLEYTVIGLALLLGTIVDELVKRRTERRG